jgi:outer membrane protein assembly factor BamD (BamD/ComL family)
VDAGNAIPAVRSLLLSTAARLYAATGNSARAVALWTRILDQDRDTPEAPQAELEWARFLRKQGDVTAATTHLEHLILTYPSSALVPQARRELELVKSAIPPSP